jgi:dephospho-CoA kinase
VLLGGGIGSGKSSIAEVFAEHGFLVIDTDRVAAEMMRPGSEAASAVEDLWPSVVVGGVVDRAELARIVFADEGQLRRLEAITHPAIATEVTRRVAESAGPVLVEIPLVHLGLAGEWSRVAVIADEEIRIARAVARGGGAADIRRRVSNQVSDDKWAEWGDVVIENSGAWANTLQSTKAAIEALT